MAGPAAAAPQPQPGRAHDGGGEFARRVVPGHYY